MKVASTASATVTDTRPAPPDDLDSLPHEQQVAYHASVIRWEQAHPEVMAAEEAAAKAKRKAERDAEKAKDAAREAEALAMARPVKPIQPDNFTDLPEAEQHAYWSAAGEYKDALDLLARVSPRRMAC